MESSVGKRTSGARPAKTGRQPALVAQAFRDGFEIASMPWQKNGILSKLLWTSRNQVLRIIPGYNPETGEIFRQNINGDEGYDETAPVSDYLSGTFHMASVAGNFGTLSSPIITDYRPGTDEALSYNGFTVINTFTRAIMNAVDGRGKSGPRVKAADSWKRWCAFNQGHDVPRIEIPKPALMMQAFIFCINGRNNKALGGADLVDADGNLLPMLAVVALNHKTSITALMNALVKPQNRNKPLDAATNNEYGPMAELDGVKLFLNSTNDAATGWSYLSPSVQAEPKGWTPSPYALTAEQVFELWHPWSDILDYMTAQEQLELCAREFGAETVNYVLGAEPSMRHLEIPSAIKEVGLGAYAALAEGGRMSGGSGDFGSTKGLGTVGDNWPKAAAAEKPVYKSPFGTPTSKPKATEPAADAKPAQAAAADSNKFTSTLERIRRAQAIRGSKNLPPPQPAVSTAKEKQSEDAAFLLEDDTNGEVF